MAQETWDTGPGFSLQLVRTRQTEGQSQEITESALQDFLLDTSCQEATLSLDGMES